MSDTCLRNSLLSCRYVGVLKFGPLREVVAARHRSLFFIYFDIVGFVKEMSEIDRWIEIAKDCNYLPENDLKVRR